MTLPSVRFEKSREMEREILYSFVSLITDANEANRQFLLRNCTLNNLEPTFCIQETSSGFHCTLILGGVLFETTSEEYTSKARAKREVIERAADRLKKKLPQDRMSAEGENIEYRGGNQKGPYHGYHVRGNTKVFAKSNAGHGIF